MNLQIIYSKRKTLAIQIKNPDIVLVRAPLKFPENRINDFLKLHNNWIERKLSEAASAANPFDITDEKRKELIKNAGEYIPDRIKFFSELMSLVPTSVKITSAKTRFGSCSGKNAICFSYYLMQYPLEAVDYVIVHELAHIVHHNHSKDFYRLIESYMPDHKIRKSMLKMPL